MWPRNIQQLFFMNNDNRYCISCNCCNCAVFLRYWLGIGFQYLKRLLEIP